MPVMRISAKGWVVIPAECRRKYGLRPGDEVTIVDYGGVLAIVPIARDPIGHGRGLLSGEPSLTQTLLETRDEERRSEAQRHARLRP
jgi:AbrB family looped-hinge helix DNA binding protein